MTEKRIYRWKTVFRKKRKFQETAESRKKKKRDVYLRRQGKRSRCYVCMRWFRNGKISRVRNIEKHLASKYHRKVTISDVHYTYKDPPNNRNAKRKKIGFPERKRENWLSKKWKGKRKIVYKDEKKENCL